MKRLLIAVAIISIGLFGLGAPALAAPPDPDTAKAVAKWVLNGGEADLRKLGTDFGELEKAANANDLHAMSTSCKHLQRDVNASQDYDPIPDKQAQASWAKALDLYEQGAKDCIKGADTANSDLLIKASKEIIDGSTDLQKVTARLKEISG
jgi:hypothetical protein